ncbi:ABC transporter substrate-binding protein [Tolypothrix campylonemoides VB511288]|nr:ABC transporter substrate-binding protein [Tolypothrix campylonemoides VB511288]
MRALALVAALALLAGCAQPDLRPPSEWPRRAVGDAPTANLRDGCVADYRPGVDYFPQKTRFAHSNQLRVSYHGHYKRVRFTPGVDTGEAIEMLLVQCGAPVPAHAPRTAVVRVPIRRLATANDSILLAIEQLGVADTLIGVPSLRSITVPSLQARAKAGLVREMYGFGHIGIEPIMAAQADVYLTFYSAYPAGNMHPTLWQLGVAALPQGDHMEAHPLGRAEWLKFLALLYNREAIADAEFARIERAYAALAARTRHVPTRPKVISGYASTRGTWDLYAAGNQAAALIRDAGGRYFLDAPTHSGSWVLLPFERVYAQGHDAAVWLGGLDGQYSAGDGPASNPHYRWFDAVRSGRVYAFNKGYLGDYAYPYHDQGMTRPHHALEDAIRALHPGLLPPGEFHFLRPLR